MINPSSKNSSDTLIAISSRYQEIGGTPLIYEISDGCLLIVLSGHLVSNQYTKAVISKTKSANYKSIILDLSQLNKIDPEDTLALLHLIKVMHLSGLKVVICGVTEEMGPPLIQDDFFIKNITFKQNLKLALEDVI